MKADTTLSTGMYARTGGYYAVNDGGAALYRISDSVPSTYSEVLGNGKYAELISCDVNICQFGGVSGYAADFAPFFFTMFDYCIERSISRAFVPAGSYPVYKAVAVPPGVEMVGDGYSTYIYEGTGNTLGATMTTCGSRCAIKNIRVGHLENDIPVVIGVSHSCGIGIGRYTYDSVKNETYDAFYSSVEDVEISDIYCDDNYVLQVEFTDGTLDRLTVSHIVAPDSVVRLTPQQTAVYRDVVYKDITCDALAVGVGGSTLYDAKFADIHCNYMRYYIGTVRSVIFERLHAVSGSDSKFGPANSMMVAAFIQNDATFRDCVIENGASLDYGIQIFQGVTTWFNCVCDGFGRYNIFNNNGRTIHCFNCDFGSATPSYMYGEGYNTISNPQGGIVGGAAYIDDTTDFRATINPTSPVTGVTSTLPSYLQRKGRTAKLFAMWTGTLTEGMTIAKLPYASWYPKTSQTVYAYGYTVGSTYAMAIGLNIGTDGNITVVGINATTGAATITFDRIAIDVTYLV